MSDIKSTADTQQLYNDLLTQLGAFIRDNATEAGLDMIYFALISSSGLLRVKLLEVGMPEKMLRKLEQRARINSINAANIARGAKQNASN
jgi:hypothetical protein